VSARRAVLRAGGVSLRLELRPLAVLCVLASAAAAGVVGSISFGEFPLAPGEVLSALAGGGESSTRFIVLELRAPRALTAVLAGAALGIAGAIFQDVARNPLVAPDVIGLTWGAALAAVVLIVLVDSAGAVSVPAAALGGALAAGVGLYALAWRGGVQGYRLVLIGVGVAALLQAGVSYVLVRGRIIDVHQAYIWLVGSLNGRSWEHVWPLALTLAVLAPAILLLARRLEALQLGDDLARSLGVGVERSRLGLLGAAVVLCGIAVAAAGPLAFVAFIAPHVARRLARSAAPLAVLPAAAAAGALLVVGADIAGRLVIAPREIPAGIVTAIVAAPYFLWLLRRANRLGVTG